MARSNKEICQQALVLGLFASSTEFWKEVKASGMEPEDVLARRQNPKQQKLGVDILKTLKLVSKELLEEMFLIAGYGGRPGGMCHPVEGFSSDEQGVVTQIHFYTTDIGQALAWAEKMVRDGCWPKTATSYSIECLDEDDGDKDDELEQERTLACGGFTSETCFPNPNDDRQTELFD